MKNIQNAIAIIKSTPRIYLLILFLLGLVLVFLGLSVLTLRNGGPQKNDEGFVLTTEEKEQQKSDIEYGNRLKTFMESYPWYDSLPPKNPKYFIAFDDGEGAFYVSLYSKNNQVLTEEYKKQVFLDLEKIGVATKSYSFNWTIR